MAFQNLPATQSASMTSREIAELTGKQHAHVMRDIRAMTERFEADPNLDWHCETEHYIDAQGKGRECYRLDRNTTVCLISGYDPVPRMRIIQRLDALESGQATQVAIGPIAEQEQTALTVLQTRLNAAMLLQTPEHIGQQEAVKAVRLSVGIDYEPLLLAATAQQVIAEQDEMLEPEDLARRLGIKNGMAMNQRLRVAGLQVKDKGQWIPTEKGAAHCVRHAWTRGEKSGYNLKWRVAVVRQVIDTEDAA